MTTGRVFVGDSDGTFTIESTPRIGQEWSIRTEFQIGLGFTHDGTPIPEGIVPSYRREAAHIVAEVYGGATILPHYGGWVSPEGAYIQESGVTIIAYGHSNRMREVAQKLLILTCQRALVVATIGAKVHAMEVFRD